MIILDTDHLTVYSNVDYSGHDPLLTRLDASADKNLALTIVSAEEQLRGWLANIHGQRDVRQQIPAYRQLQKLLLFLGRFAILPFDERAADEFQRLRQRKIRIGSMDLKIACIARVHDALLLTANRRDFRQVPGLRFENWLDHE
jgi:tRNA(fMet)-specific endonuclease VapC